MSRAITINFRAIRFQNKLIYSGRDFEWVLAESYRTNFILTVLEGDHQPSEVGEGGKTQKIARKLGILVLGLEMNAVAIHSLHWEKKVLGHSDMTSIVEWKGEWMGK